MVEPARPYVPGFIGDDEIEVPALQEELDRIAAVIGEMSEGLAILYGEPSFINLDTTPRTIVNWGRKTVSSGWNGNFDDSLGQIIVGQPGLYAITFNVVGTQGNLTVNEVITLRLRLVDPQGPLTQDLALFEINSSKSQLRNWAGTLVQEIEDVPTTLELQLYASAALGEFSFTRCNFQVARYKIEGVE